MIAESHVILRWTHDSLTLTGWGFFLVLLIAAFYCIGRK